jgi:hypothetical protein
MSRLAAWTPPIVRFHRAILILATIGVAVAAARIATEVGEVGAWLLVAAFALLLLLADLSREMEEAAGTLADSSGVDRRTARQDIYRSRRPSLFVAGVAAAIILWVAAAVAYGFGLSASSGDPVKRPKHATTATSLKAKPRTTVQDGFAGADTAQERQLHLLLA